MDTDQTPNTMTIDVNAVNDAPDGADNTITMLEDAVYTFASGDFGFTEAVEGDALFSVIISTLPANGVLELSGVAVTLGQEIPAGQIGNLTFTPVANANGTSYASFDFQVKDDGGTANGGVDTDPVANTITFDVTSVNDEPAGADNTITTNEDTAYTFAAADFGFSDVNDSPANALMSVIITAIPTNGTLTLNGVAVTNGQEIAAADINSNLLVFTPAANANGAGYDSFTFQVRDDGGTADGGVNTDLSANTITIDVNAVNDEPAGADNTVTTLEDTGFTFATADFGFTDAVEGDSLQAVVITALPTNGTLTLNGAAVTAGQAIAAADITSGLLVFTPAANANGAGYDTFTFQVQDDGGTANGGVDTDQTPNTMTIDVTPVNDAPDGADNTITMLENNVYTFASGDFGFTDAVEGDGFLSVIISTLPADGTLELSGVAVTLGQEIAAGQIGNLTFTPAANANGASYDAFTFQVKDNGGTANGGVDTDPVANTITFDVDPINSEPTGADNTVTTNEDAAYTFAATDFGFADAGDTPPNVLDNVI
ncbi:MAG: Ig-like domain-containing protein, partial [Pseudomonadota bacterium]|nr:Ig-like domain-containing protein [Pseudomonadota bacterium]